MKWSKSKARWVGVIAGLLLVVGCSDDPDGGDDAGADAGRDASDVVEDVDEMDVGGDTEDDTGPSMDTGTDAGDTLESDGGGDTGGDADGGIQVPDDPDCDPLDPSRCSLPWPSNKYLEEDADRQTGYTLSFTSKTLPISNSGATVDPEPYRRLDGYGVGQPIMAAFDNLDASELPNEREIPQSMADDAEILLYRVDGESLERVPYWAELDHRADADADTKMLIVRPAVILDEATRYVVAFRGLTHEDGSPVEASTAFDLLRSGETRDDSLLGQRQARFDEIFDLLEGAGVDPQNLTLAWDFHTATSQALHGHAPHAGQGVRDYRTERPRTHHRRGQTLRPERRRQWPTGQRGQGVAGDRHFPSSPVYETPRDRRAERLGVEPR